MKRGHSLIETVIALFVFAVAILFVAVSADFALSAGRRSTLETRAVLLAQSQLDRARQWCQQTSPSTRFAAFAAYPGLGSWQSSAGLEYKVDLMAQTTYSPSYTSEIFLTPGQRRCLDASLLRVRVTARWSSSPRDSVSLNSLIGDSRRDWKAANPIVISPVGAVASPLAQGASQDFTAVGYDDLGQPIPDLEFTWSVIPSTSCGMVDQRPDGLQATFTHHMLKVPGPGYVFAPAGEVLVAATARYWGVERTATYALQLQ